MRALAVRAHQKGLELTYRLDPELPTWVEGDPNRLRQVLLNLVGNAIKFTEQGEVAVFVEPQGITPEVLEIHVRIVDTGIGIPPEKQGLLFQAFSQADTSTTRRFGGTGLGLAICSRLVALMGGRIWLESTAGVGSTFHFTTKLKLAQTQKPKGARPSMDLQDIPVLIVDDNQTNRDILVEFTTRWGMQPTAVESGGAALKILKTAQLESRPFRLVLLDCRMPIMDGFGVAEHIKQDPALGGVVIMMLTSDGRPGDGARCRDLGIQSYLVKPVHKSDLLQAIQVALERSPDPPEMPVAARENLRAAPRKARILLAEDNAINQTLMVRLLTKLGHEAVVANNGKEALDRLRQEQFDMIFMDVQMPELDGFAATAQIRAEEKKTGKHIPIVAMTAHALKGDRERCLEAGMESYICKPVDFKQVQQEIERRCGMENSGSNSGVAASAPEWDFEAALARVGGDLDLLRQVTEVFLQEYPKTLSQLCSAIREGDGKTAREAIHSLKGELAYFAAEGAVRELTILRDLLLAGDMEGAANSGERLRQELDGIRPQLARLLEVQCESADR
jgi:CheY-like chemotaxis protein